MNKITAEELKSREWHSLSMGELRAFIDKNTDLPDNTMVLVERVEDRYFDKSNFQNKELQGWNVYCKEGFHYYNTKNFNHYMQEEIERREKGEESEYPSIKDPKTHMVDLDTNGDELREQFYVPHCISRDKDNDFVLIYSHY